MKKIIILIALFLNCMSFGQVLDCPHLPNPDFPEPPTNIFSRSTLVVPPASTRYVFNVRFHIVKNTNGTGLTANYGENEVMNAIMTLNTHYNQYNIFFKYKGFDVIQNTTYTKIRSFAGGAQNQNATHPFFADILQYSKTGMTTPVYDYKAMNLFIVEGIDISTTTNNAQTAGVAYTPGIDSVYAYNTFLSSTLLHEIGHNFNLLHTHQVSGTTGCERVDGLNSATAGDLVTDTPASHPLTFNNINTTNCSYQNPTLIRDCVNVVYTNVPIRNFMSSNNSCRTISANYLPGNAVFTQGQANRMRELIDTYYNNVNNAYGFKNAKNTIESLYEPFAVVLVGGSQGGTNPPYASSSSRTFTPNEEGTGANVWNCPIYTQRFQKGLTYEFSNSTIGVLTKLPTEQYNYTLNNNWLGVKLAVFNQNILQFGGIECFGTFEPYIKGDVKSLTSFGSSNISIQTLDEISATNPNLLNDLQSQKFHIITKETESGYTNQKVIYKN